MMTYRQKRKIGKPLVPPPRLISPGPQYEIVELVVILALVWQPTALLFQLVAVLVSQSIRLA
jgi:hypothetical protein